jgi:hypothetical protein
MQAMPKQSLSNRLPIMLEYSSEGWESGRLFVVGTEAERKQGHCGSHYLFYALRIQRVGKWDK